MPAWSNRIVGHGTEAPDQLLANPRNWRIHPKAQQDALSGLLDKVGWVQDVIVNQRTGHVVDGHQCVSLAISRQEKEIPVVYVDLSPEDEALVLASLDPLAAMAVTDQEMLSSLMLDVSAEGALADMLGSLIKHEPKGGLTDPDAIPEAPESITKTGDLWLLGEHRLLCGDSTKGDDVTRLMDGAQPAMTWADPPYGIDYVPNYSNSNRTYKNDRIVGDEAIDVSWLSLFHAPRLYLCTRWDVFPAWLAAVPTVKNLIVWDKGQGAAGNLKGYAPRHEFLIYAASDKGDLYATARQDNVWEVPGFAQFTARRAEDSWGDHPTQKPCALIERALVDSSRIGEIVVDPFSGTGAGLIACERLGRRCYALEIEPRYVDVAIKRWEMFTGQQAVRA